MTPIRLTTLRKIPFNGAWAMFARERTARQIRAAINQRRVYCGAYLRRRAKRHFRHWRVAKG